MSLISITGCRHEALHVDVSPHAAQAGFQRTSPEKLAAAATPSGRVAARSKKTESVDLPLGLPEPELCHTFPGPLVLPQDCLALDVDDPPQSVRSWIQEKARNKVTKEKKTLYVAGPPGLDELPEAIDWVNPALGPRNFVDDVEQAPDLGIKPPKLKDVREYLGAFYHGFSVKQFPRQFKWTTWDEGVHPSTRSKYVGLRLGTYCTRIRARPCPDGMFLRQFNSNDILDAVLAALPADAYSLLLMVDHDLYEDEEDDFLGGRAYGGSRIAVVSSARYHPFLDAGSRVDLAHMWPASQCKAYIDVLCGLSVGAESSMNTEPDEMSPIRAAVGAASKAPDPTSDLAGLWHSRVVRTASHELGHCLGMGHCAYFACIMQGTAGMAEDLRQPPYLCPICLEKIKRATADIDAGRDDKKYLVARYNKILKYCEKWQQVGMFAGYHAWLGARVKQLEA